jgi:hypothetical protein
LLSKRKEIASYTKLRAVAARLQYGGKVGKRQLRLAKHLWIVSSPSWMPEFFAAQHAAYGCSQ